MKLLLDTVLLDTAGEPVVEDNKDVICRDLLLRAILTPPMKEGKPVQDTKKVEKFKMAMKIQAVELEAEVEFVSEEITLLKNAVDNVYASPLVVGRLYELLGEI